MKYLQEELEETLTMFLYKNKDKNKDLLSLFNYLVILYLDLSVMFVPLVQVHIAWFYEYVVNKSTTKQKIYILGIFSKRNV